MKIKISVIVFAAMFITGCGHNMITYSDGIGLDTTINPETYTFGFNFRYGKILQSTVKDRTTITMNADGKMNNVFNKSAENSSAVSAPALLTINTGNQITGYEVDLVKILTNNPESFKTWLEVRKHLDQEKNTSK